MSEENNIEDDNTFDDGGELMIDINHTWGASFDDMKESFTKARNSGRRLYKIEIGLTLFTMVVLIFSFINPLYDFFDTRDGLGHQWFDWLVITILSIQMIVLFKSTFQTKKAYLAFQEKLDTKATY